MILGLKRGEVILAPHQAGWRAAYEEERSKLALLLGATALAIEHVGSTAVPGLDAKPVIDIVIAVESWEAIATWPEVLSRADYTYFGDRENLGDHFFARGSDELRTHYLHVVILGSDRWENYLKFRDELRNDAALREEYQQLKRDLAARHPNDRNAYTRLKEPFVRRVLTS